MKKFYESQKLFGSGMEILVYMGKNIFELIYLSTLFD